jgi:hypothetical protein
MYVSRLASRLLAAGLTLWCGASSANAQLLYEQTPSGPAYNHAYWSSPTPGSSWTVLAADSFQLTERKLLSRITWWGIYGYLGQNNVPPLPEYDSFVIRIYADDGGQPGAVVATFETGFGTTSRTATGRTQYWPYEPDPYPPGQPYPAEEYSYKWTLPAPLPLEANTTYWLSIVNHPLYAPEARWNWSHSASPNNLGVMRGWTDGSSPVMWEAAIEPYDDGIGGVLANAAFRLDSFAPPSYATYEQPRLNNGGGALAATTEWADSFVMTEASTIKRIVWWGGYGYAPGTTWWPPWVPDNFTINIYADDAGEPGTVLATYAAGEVFRWEYDGNNWLQFLPPGDPNSDIYSLRFEYTLPTPFTVQPNTRYWLGIVNPTTNENWLWQASDSTHELGLRFRDATVPGSPWAPQTAPVHDVAFRIETAPPPAFEQRPTHDNQMMSTLPNHWTVADPFQLTETTDITRISWWGGYYNATSYGPPGSDNFTVHIFADNGGQPGAVIATYTPGDQVFRTMTGAKAELEWPPFVAADEFFFSMALPAPLTLQANTRYWISINTTTYANYVGFGWEYSRYNSGPGLYSSFGDPVTGPWQHWGNLSSGMAFRLDR